MDKKWYVLISMCLLTVMLNIDVTALNIAIPVISHEFQASLSQMQWVVNAYVLMSAMLQILGGKLGDAYGHRKIFLLGTALFILSSIGAGFSFDAPMLIGFRVLQGISLGIAYPMTIVLAFASFPKTQQGFALSLIVGAMGLSLAIGPPIGGILVETAGWRWIFYVNVPIGILAYILAAAFCKKEKIEKTPPIDLKGASLLILSLFGIVFSLNQAQDWGFGSPLFLSLFIGGILIGAVLYLAEKKAADPIVEFSLFKHRNFLFNNLIRLVVQLIFIPVLFFVPFYLQNISQVPSLASGFAMMAMTVVIGVLSPIAGKWVDKIGDKIPTIASMVLFLLGSLPFLFFRTEPNWLLLSAALALIGAGTAIAFVSTVTGALAPIPASKQGVATGIVFTIAWLGCALGIAISGAAIALKSHAALLSHTAASDAAFRAARGLSPLSQLGDPQMEAWAGSAFMEGLSLAALIWVGLSLFGLVLALLQKKPPPKEKAHIDLLIP